MSGPRHIEYFDRLRFWAMCGVIFMHTAAELLRGEMGLEWELLNAVTSLAFTAVPLFLMMSGYLVCSGEKTADLRVLLRQRLPRLLIPLAAWTAIAALRLCLVERTMTVSAFLGRLVGAFSTPIAVHFWYMYLMVALYVLSPLLHSALRGLDRKGHCYLLALIALVTAHAMILAVLPDRFDRYLAFDIFEKLRIFGGHLCTFLLGYYLGRLDRKIPNKALAAAALGLLAAIILGTHVLTARRGTYTATFQNQSAGFEVALAACLFLLCKQWARPPRLLRQVPVVPLGLPIYLMHGILLAVFHGFGWYPANFWETIAMTVLNLIVCYLCLKTAASVRPLCYALTGMPYAAACRSCNWQYTWRKWRKKGP